jgi:hypothetical protein
MEEVESRLRNLYRLYKFNMRPGSKSRLSHFDRIRYLGGMESLLQTLGKLASGIPFEYKPITRKILYFISYKDKENYEELILRNCEEFITTSTNTPCHYQ